VNTQAKLYKTWKFCGMKGKNGSTIKISIRTDLQLQIWVLTDILFGCLTSYSYTSPLIRHPLQGELQDWVSPVTSFMHLPNSQNKSAASGLKTPD